VGRTPSRRSIDLGNLSAGAIKRKRDVLTEPFVQVGIVADEQPMKVGIADNKFGGCCGYVTFACRSGSDWFEENDESHD
jgi:hypothetical protein